MTNETKNVPELRFKEFSKEWEDNNLKDITTLLKDGTHGTHKNVENGPWLLSAKNIKNNTINISDEDRKISITDYNKIYKNYTLEREDILLSIVGTIGRVSMVKDPVNIAFQRSVAIIRFSKPLESKFFLYLFGTKEFKKKLYRNQVVSAQPGIYLGDLAKFNIIYPLIIEEQQKIGNFFSKLDRQIELEEQKLKKLKEQKKGYMQKIFSQEIRFKDDNGNDYPEWESKKFLDIFKLAPSKNNQIKSSEVVENGIIPVVDQGKDIFLGYSNEKDKAIEDFDNVIVYGDHTTIIKYIKEPFIIGGDGVKLLESNDGSLIHYLYILLQYFNVKPEGYKRHYSILKNKMMNISNTKEEQEKIGDFFNELDELIEKQSSKIVVLKQRKKGFLQKMFV